MISAAVPVLFLAAALAGDVHRYALIIGNDASLDPVRAPLRFADDDAARMYELIAPVAVKAHLLTALDRESQEIFAPLVSIAEPPALANVEAAAKDLHARIAEDRAQGIFTELYFFYSGHGDVDDGEGSVALADGRLTRTRLRALLFQGARADRIHVIVDACKSYFLVAGRGSGGQRAPADAGFATPDETNGVGYLLSTSSDAESHEWSAFSAGIFSHEVRSALVGGADANDDGAVDYEELEAFVGVANDSIPFPAFRPSVYIRAPANDARAVVFAAKGLSHATVLELGAGANARVSIRDQRGLRYADVHKAEGAALHIALIAPMRYDVRIGEAVYALDAQGQAADAGTLVQSPEDVSSKAEIHRAFEHLFESPFGAAELRGFRVARRGRAESPDLSPASADPARPRGRDTWIAPLMTGGAVSIAGGIALAFAGGSVRVDAARSSSESERSDLNARATGLVTGAIVLAAVGAAAIGAGVWRYLSEEPAAQNGREREE